MGRSGKGARRASVLRRPPAGRRPAGGRRPKAPRRGAGSRWSAEREARSRAEATADRLGRLQQVTAALSAATTSEEVAEAIFQVGLDALAADGGTLWFPAGGGLAPAAHTHGFFERGRAASGQPEALRAALQEAFDRVEPVWLESAADLMARHPGRLAPGRALAEGAWAALPLRADGGALGVLGLAFAAPRRFPPEERSFVLAVAHEAAQALVRTRLHEEQRRLRAEAEAAAEERQRLVADLQRTLRERDESAALLDAFFDNAPVGLALVDPELRIVRVNPALAAMNGLGVAEHLGRTLAEVLPGLPVEELARGVARILATRQPVVDVEIEGETPAAPGERQRFLESWYPVVAGDRVIGVGALVRDVTADRRAADFQRLVLAVVGHDLRSPLLAITSSVALLLHGEPLPDRSAKAVRRILSAATRMDGIARALADYARLQMRGGIPLDRRRVDFRDLAREVAAEMEAAHPGRTVRCQAPAAEPGEWDPDRLGQVVANLLGNALEHGAPDGPVALACQGDAETLVFEVSNRGRPIPAEFRPSLFEPFRRGPGADEAGRGLGLGLFIARQIVLAHGGAIEVRSGEAEGTSFTVRLPRWPPAA